MSSSTDTALPRYAHGARVLYIRDTVHADTAITRAFYSQSPAASRTAGAHRGSPDTDLESARVVGIDLEWRPSFVSGAKPRPVALVQIATEDTILLLQLTAMTDMPAKLVALLSDEGIIKAGVNVIDDCRRLFHDYNISTRGVLELTYLARGVDVSKWPGPKKSLISLARLTEAYTGCCLAKGKVARSNWEKVLTDTQLTYAANDAHAGYSVARELISRLRSQREYLFLTSSHSDELDALGPQPLYCYVCNVMEGSAISLDGRLWFPPDPPVPQTEEKDDGEGVHEATVGPGPQESEDQALQAESTSLTGILYSVAKRLPLRIYGS